MGTSEHRKALASGLRMLGSWFVFSNVVRIASAVFVTRRLDPEDFVIMAVVLAIQGFATKLTAFNMLAELVRARELDRESLRVAWTYELVRNTALWGILVVFAPVFANWMDHPEVTGPLRVTSLTLLITGFTNPRIVELRRLGRFGMLGFIDASGSASYAFCSILFVCLKPDYWALVYAGLVGAAVPVILVYAVAPWRPGLSFSLRRARPMLAFGGVLLVETAFQALREHGMVFLLNANVNEIDLGYYNRAVAFSLALALAASSIFWRVAYPVYSQHELAGHSSLAEAARAQWWVLLATLPVTALLGIFRVPLISFVLDSKWAPMASLWAWFVLAGALALAGAPYEAAFQARRRERIGLLILAASTVLQLLLAWVLLPTYGVTSAGIAACLGGTFSILAYRIIGARLRAISPS